MASKIYIVKELCDCDEEICDAYYIVEVFLNEQPAKDLADKLGRGYSYDIYDLNPK